MWSSLDVFTCYQKSCCTVNEWHLIESSCRLCRKNYCERDWKNIGSGSNTSWAENNVIGMWHVSSLSILSQLNLSTYCIFFVICLSSYDMMKGPATSQWINEQMQTGWMHLVPDYTAAFDSFVCILYFDLNIWLTFSHIQTDRHYTIQSYTHALNFSS